MSTQSESSILFSTLRYLPQAAFCVRGDLVCFSNPAARALLVAEGTPVTDYLDDDAELYHTLGSAPVQLGVVLAGRRLRASVHDDGGLRVFITCPDPAAAAVPPDTLQSVSQSLRTPLTNLLGAASSLFPLLEEQENPELQKQMARMNRAMYQLLRLSFGLSDMRAMLSDELCLHREKLELTAHFAAFFDRLALLCREAGVTLRYTLPDKPFSGWIDRQRVEQAILHLVSNALKFTPDGSTLDIRLERSGDRILLCVSDSGEGMDADLLSTAFSRFDRPAQLDDPRWGVGFGLPFVRRVAQLHGGAVMLQSQPQGGTAVTMSLSIKPPEQPEEPLKSPVAAMDYAGGYRHDLVELSVVLPPETFDTSNVN